MLSGDIENVRMLLKAGADPNAENVYRETPLTFAAATGELASVKMLLQAGADPSITTAGGETPAQVASRFGHADIAALIEKAREH
jgi:ankyrin repeat protein